ncbi:hypothetical protein [Paenibacillus sp. NEAU-GSW1]|uniref:hypothetical protein n=1 Tax=Paenibacillus sp. NEAU-GSW1 TaxID=2682486 RepID=UPI0012E0DBFB|nr:hypothetical protein [Paenibacillus sp. NEAU-GSW1]MUT66469.1 hypothetical protein [Paenibacillus sp. NEAU-GSW1]
MTKAEQMDRLMSGYDTKISSTQLLALINESYHVELELPQADIDHWLEGYGDSVVTGACARAMINERFSINLDALSALEGKRISLFSKNRWMLRHEHDWFAVHTGEGDVDVRIRPTPYYEEHTGSTALPERLSETLVHMGYGCDHQGCYYANPEGQAVPDAFKGKTMMAVMQAIQEL